MLASTCGVEEFEQDVEVGSLFAKDFKVLRRLRSGGMGSVFIVEQLSTKKQRALKLLAPSLADHEDIRERFVREAQAASAIDSDHVVEIVSAGVDEPTNTPFLVMELLKGEDLADRIDRTGSMSLEEVGQVLSQVGHALALAHKAGIIHRDLKPENIFLATSRRPETAFCAKILDFGVAKMMTTGGDALGTLPVGSPAYMAPEQTDAYGNITPAADVWSLALVTFFLLTGRSYWLGGEQNSIPALLREVCFDPIEPPSERAKKLGVTTEFSAAYDAWFMHCVEREIENRYPEAGAAVAAFAAEVIAPTVARPSVHGDRVSEPKVDAARTSTPGVTVPQEPAPSAPLEPGANKKVSRVVFIGSIGGIVAGNVIGLLAYAFTRHPPEKSEAHPSAQVSSEVAVAPKLSASAKSHPTAEPARPRATATARASSSAQPVVEPTPVVKLPHYEQGSCPEGRVQHGGDDPFCIDQTEVTVAAFKDCVAHGRCHKLEGKVTLEGLRTDALERYSELCVDATSDGSLPVNCVSVEDADRFCRSHDGRLPLESEWLRAASGRGSSKYPWGEKAPSESLLNVCGGECESWAYSQGIFATKMFEGDDGEPGPAPVGSFPRGAAPLGEVDLMGNVAEWVIASDSQKAVARGGSYFSSKPAQLGERIVLGANARSHVVGFRCASSL